MKILGNGVDIVDNLRIKKSIKSNNFIKRIYSNDEIEASKNVKNKVNFFAKRFAAKEAFVKSLGMGFRNGINFKDISVRNNNLGKPELCLSKKMEINMMFLNYVLSNFKFKNIIALIICHLNYYELKKMYKRLIFIGFQLILKNIVWLEFRHII